MGSNPYKNLPHNDYNIFEFQKLIEAVYLNRSILLWKLALGLHLDFATQLFFYSAPELNNRIPESLSLFLYV